MTKESAVCMQNRKRNGKPAGMHTQKKKKNNERKHAKLFPSTEIRHQSTAKRNKNHNNKTKKAQTGDKKPKRHETQQDRPYKQ